MIGDESVFACSCVITELGRVLGKQMGWWKPPH